MPRKMRQIPMNAMRFSNPMMNRKPPEAKVPAVLSTAWTAEPSPASVAAARVPRAMSAVSTNTIPECPMANQNPTDLGRPPSAISLRVVLSIAAMWSASKACRRPKT